VPRGILYGGGLAVLWAILAVISPTTTYHLAPLLVAGAPAVLDAADEQRDSTRRVLALAAAGTALALIATGILAIADALQGPSLLPSGGAVLESIVFSLIGGVVGVAGGAVLNRR